ncbi:MAG: YhfC family intramembrane metalloprotease [Thaumarchaeota archaeon]|nr:YhfC family intramembrane metalloprotease [Nitrososphaerota archaeon]
MNPISVLVALLSVLPALLILAYLGSGRRRCLYYGLLGALGWALAFGMRIPLITLPISLLGPPLALSINFALYTSFLAGLFEEFTRFAFIHSLKPKGMREVASIGLGWGLFEALVVYLIPVMPSMGLSTPMALLLGAIERNSATAIHVGLSFVVTKALKNRWLILTALLAHYLVDAIASIVLRLHGPLLAELVISLMALALLIPSILSYK